MTPEEKRLVMRGLQTKGSANRSTSLETDPMFIILKAEGFVYSNDPRLAQIEPKYPTDAIWKMKTRYEVELFDLGLFVESTGRKPTRYSLKPIPESIKPKVVEVPKVDHREVPKVDPKRKTV